MGVFQASDFRRGKTYHDTGTTVASADYDTKAEGKRVCLPNWDPSDKSTLVTQEPLEAIQVRNVATIALLPGRLCAWAAGYRGKRVDGYTNTAAAEVAGVVDWALPSTGVPVGDVFHLVVKGRIKTCRSIADYSADITPGVPIVALTAATSQCTTAGRFTYFDMTVTTSLTYNQLVNRFGKAATTSATSAGATVVLCDIDCKLS
jgi:hypothetical protein